MVFAEWLLGYAGAKIGDRVLKALRGDVLMRDLENAIDQWRRTLPDNARLGAVAALFPSIKFEAELQSRPALKALREEMGRSRVPGHGNWVEALAEQWRQVKATIDDPQPFFTLTEDEARTHLHDLASRLVDTCSLHERLFRPTVLALLLDFQAQIESLTAKGAIDTVSQNLPLTTLAIDWTDLMYQIAPHYQEAMAGGLPWPGAYASMTEDEYRHYRLLKSLLIELSTNDANLIAMIDMLRRHERIDAAWHQQRAALIDHVTRIEAATKGKAS